MSWFQPHSDNDLEIMWKWYNRNLKTKCKSAIKSLWDQRKAGFFAKLEVPLQVSHNYYFFFIVPGNYYNTIMTIDRISKRNQVVSHLFSLWCIICNSFEIQVFTNSKKRGKKGKKERPSHHIKLTGVLFFLLFHFSVYI